MILALGLFLAVVLLLLIGYIGEIISSKLEEEEEETELHEESENLHEVVKK